MAPEVLRDDRYTAVADIWSLGATLYFVASRGRFLFSSIKEVMDAYDAGARWRPPSLPGAMGSTVTQLVAQMLVVVAHKRDSAATLLRLASSPRPSAGIGSSPMRNAAGRAVHRSCGLWYCGGTQIGATISRQHNSRLPAPPPPSHRRSVWLRELLWPVRWSVWTYQWLCLSRVCFP